ncbi:MAG: transporter substrate-binding domain-containing protein, partial [Clostridia bacterium]|nr:transporter substrate-binding domain-containing protein [Deltaproteobacteria bacterium]
GYDKSATLVVYDTTQGPELDLLAGRIDAMVGNEVSYFVGFFKRPDAKDYEFVGPQLTGGVLGEGAGIAVRKEDTALRDRFNKAIDAIVADGSYERISKKYFPFKVML